MTSRGRVGTRQPQVIDSTSYSRMSELYRGKNRWFIPKKGSPCFSPTITTHFSFINAGAGVDVIRRLSDSGVNYDFVRDAEPGQVYRYNRKLGRYELDRTIRVR